MNRIILMGLISALAVPSLLSAHNGSDDIPAGMLHPNEMNEMHGDRGDQERKMRPPMNGSGETRPPKMWSGETRPPKGSGAMMPPELKGLHLAIGDLSPEDRASLVKMIRDYLTSKGLDLTKYAEVRDDIRGVRKEGAETVKNMRDQMKDSLKARREAMQAKIKELKGNGEGKKQYTGHVTLMK